VDSQAVVKALVEVDPGFVQLCETLFGKAVDATDIWEYLYTPEGIAKMGPGASDVSVPGGTKVMGRGQLRPMAVTKPPGAQVLAPKKPTPIVAAKAFEEEDGVPIVWSGEFSKFDTDKRQAFGWASVVEINGQPVIDLQGDLITPDDLEDAAYAFVRKSRVGGTQHARDEFDRPVQAGVLIESKVWTDQKYEAFAKSLNMDPALFADAPRGWEAGFQYEDDATWTDIRTGRKTGFSVHGRGKRVAVSA
jgi:hypothetical protein